MVSIFNQINAGNFRRVFKDFPYPRLSISEFKESLGKTEKLDKISREGNFENEVNKDLKLKNFSLKTFVLVMKKISI